MDIEKEFLDILHKHNFDNGSCSYRDKIYLALQSILKDISGHYDKIALKCGGEHTLALLDDFGDILSVKCIIDQEPDKVSPKIKRYGIPVVKECAPEVDAIIISSYEYRAEVKETLVTQIGQDVIDIYELLGEKGYDLTKGYYRYSCTPYTDIIEKKQCYVKAENVTVKAVILNDVIGAFLDIRDIVSGLYWTDVYIAEKYEGYQEKIQLKADLKALIFEITEELQKRPQKDILWFWQDGLPYEILTEMNFVSASLEHGIFFEQAHASSPDTRSVYSRILDQIDEWKMFTEQPGKFQGHVLTDFLKDKGYVCRKVNRRCGRKIELETFDYFCARMLIRSDTAATELYWEAMREILLSKEPLFLLIHTGMETHAPVIAPSLMETKGYYLREHKERLNAEGSRIFRDRLVECAKYIDKELQFFWNCLGENTIRIFMSDHGSFLSNISRRYTYDCSHHVLAAVGGALPAKRYCGLFNNLNFIKFLSYMFTQTEEHEKSMFSDAIQMNGADIYDLNYINGLIEIGLVKYGIAYCGILTLKDRYIMLGTGEEIYHILPEETINHIEDVGCQERICELRRRTENRFLDIKRLSKFSNSHLLYEAIGKERNIKIK